MDANTKVAGLTRNALYQIARAISGPIINTNNGWSTNSVADAFKQLTDRGFMSVRKSPKGRKSYYELTPEGTALVPAVNAYFAQVKAEQDAEVAKRNAEDRIRDAAPDLLEALRCALLALDVATTHLAEDRQEILDARSKGRAAIEKALKGA